MYGSMMAEFDVQRTIKRVELAAFLCILKKWLDPPRCMSTTKELLTGFGEEKENASIEKLAMLTCGFFKMGRVVLSSNFGGSGARQGAPHKERQERDVAIGEVCD